MSSHKLPSRGTEPHRGELAGVRPAVLDDAHDRDSRHLEPTCLFGQMRLVTAREHDHVRARRVPLLERVADRMADLRGAKALAQVTASQDVVRQRSEVVLGAALSRGGAFDRAACPPT